jgi:hypothetical protein
MFDDGSIGFETVAFDVRFSSNVDVLHWMSLSRMFRAPDYQCQKSLGSIPASSDTVESEGRQMKQC